MFIFGTNAKFPEIHNFVYKSAEQPSTEQGMFSWTAIVDCRGNRRAQCNVIIFITGIPFFRSTNPHSIDLFPPVNEVQRVRKMRTSCCQSYNS